MSMSNFTELVNLCADSELRYLPSGKPVLNFRIAWDTGYGENKKSSFATCALYGERANTLAQYLKKGTQVLVQGDLWVQEGKDNKVYISVDVSNIKFAGKREKVERVKDERSDLKPEPVLPEPKTHFDDLADDIPF
jgi:single-strand DNA-binding protein